MAKTKEIKSEARYTFSEATGVLLGHEVGAGILSIPYIASLNNWYDFIWILLVTFALNTLLHLMISELSLNNNGSQFVECMKVELFKGKETKGTKIVTWVIFFFLGLAVITNCTTYITGSASVLSNWFGLKPWISMLVYFAIAGFIVVFGMKVVGICEKYSCAVLVGVIAIFAVVVMFSPSAGSLTYRTENYTVVLGLYSIVSFAMSAVMSVPTVVKGLDGDVKKIRGSIVVSEIINTCLIATLAIATVLGAGAANLSPNNPASLDLGNYLKNASSNPLVGNTVRIFGYVFSLFAYSTSLWANTLDLRDMLCEQSKSMNKGLAWFISGAPSLALAIALGVTGTTTLSKLSTLSGGIQVITGAAVVIAFAISRKKAEQRKDFLLNNTITGSFGTPFWCFIVILSSMVATYGSIVY